MTTLRSSRREPRSLGSGLALALALGCAAACGGDESPEAPSPVAGVAGESPSAQAPGRGLVTREADAVDGYTLFAPVLSNKTYLVDMDGEVAHSWRTRDYGSGERWMYLLDDGQPPARAAARWTRARSSGAAASAATCERLRLPDGERSSGSTSSPTRSATQHHDIEPLPERQRPRSLRGTTDLGRRRHRAPGETPIRVGAGRAVARRGDRGPSPRRPKAAEVVWQWRAWDHIDPGLRSRSRQLRLHVDSENHPERIDVNADQSRRAPTCSRRRSDASVEAAIERQMRAAGLRRGRAQRRGRRRCGRRQLEPARPQR